MEIMLYPYHSLPSYMNSQNPNSWDVKIASALLYFDSVVLGRPGYPNELSLPTKEDVLVEMNKIIERRGDKVVKSFFTQRKDAGLTIDEMSTLTFLRYSYNEQKFLKSYQTILEEGLIKIVTLAEATEKAREKAEKSGEKTNLLSMATVLEGYSIHRDVFDQWPTKTNEIEDFEKAFDDSDGVGLGCLYLRHLANLSNPETLIKKDDSSKWRFMRESFLLDLYHQAMFSFILQLPLVSTSDVHLKLRSKYIEKYATIKKQHNNSATDSIAFKLFTETLSQFPAIIPRSPEAILEVRRQLSEELEELRESITYAAQDILYENEEGQINSNIIKRIVDTRFVRPVNNLNRKLAHPNRDLLRNLVATDPVVVGGITFVLSITQSNPILLTAALGSLGATLAASLKTYFDRKNTVEQSGLGFIINASKYKNY